VEEGGDGLGLVAAVLQDQRGDGQDEPAQQRRRADGQRRESRREPAEEATEAQLRRDHHEGEEYRDGGHVHGGERPLRRHGADGQQRDRAEQGDARAVELQPGQPAEEHADVDGEEDRYDSDFIHCPSQIGACAPPTNCY